MAIETGNLELSRRFVENGAKLDLGCKSCAGCTPLSLSLLYGRMEIAEYLVLQGASTDVRACHLRQTRGFTPFHYAANLGDERFLRVLLGKSPKGLSGIRDPVHPIHLAIARGHAECVNIMIDHCCKSKTVSSFAGTSKLTVHPRRPKLFRQEASLPLDRLASTR